MKVVRNYLYSVGYQILAIIVPLITSYYVSRVLRPEGVGANAFTNSIIQYFVLLANMGIGFYGNREIAYVRDDITKLKKTFLEIQFIKTFMTIVSYVFFLIFMFFYERNRIYMWAQSINLLAVAFDISWFYQGIEDFKKTVLKNSLVKIISTILIFVFIKNASDVTIYIILLAISTLLGNLTLWPGLRKILGNVYIGKLLPWRHFFPMLSMFVPQIAVQIYVQLNRTMLGIMVSEKASGFYQYSDGLVKLVLALVTSAGTVMLPHVANALANGDKDSVDLMMYKSFDFVSAITIPMAFGLAAISHDLAPLYYGKGYEPVGTAMMIESVIVILIGWSNVIGIQYLLPADRVKEYTVSVTLGSIVNIILNIPLIYFLGLNGAMISTICSEVTVTGYQLLAVKRNFYFNKLFKDLWKYLLSAFVMFVTICLLRSILKATWVSLLLEVTTGVVSYLILIILLRTRVISNGKELIRSRGKL